MFCPKCGAEIPENSVFCSACGSNVKETVLSESSAEPNSIISERDAVEKMIHIENNSAVESENSKEKKFVIASESDKELIKTAKDAGKGLLKIVIAVFICVVGFLVIQSFFPNVIDEVSDQVADIKQKDDPNIWGVKNACPYSYPDITYDQAFSSFFSAPTWKYFIGTKEGTDEDGDGKPDSKSENVKVVEFTGYCTYMDNQAKARIQFTIDEDSDSFTATYLSLNDIPQNKLILASLIYKAFDEYDNSR